MSTFRELIEQHVTLTGDSSTSGGWRRTNCKVCNDHGKKGPRGGFRFDGDRTSYNCFNCGVRGTYVDHGTYNISNDMREIATAFGISDELLTELNFEAFSRKQGDSIRGITRTPSQRKALNLNATVLDLPVHFILMSELDPDYKWRVIAEDYLLSSRGLQPQAYPYYLLDPSCEHYVTKLQWTGRLLIPVYNANDEIIYWQGRDLTGTRNHNKYLSVDTNKSNILFGLDQVSAAVDTPLYVVEGIFDAMHLNGVALLGKTISEEQAAILNRSHRKKVYIPDRTGGGWKTAQHAISLGWSISTPDIGDQSDINDAINAYGSLYVKRSIAENIVEGSSATMRLSLYCTDYFEQERPKTESP